jgi:hypothetical protein
MSHSMFRKWFTKIKYKLPLLSYWLLVLNDVAQRNPESVLQRVEGSKETDECRSGKALLAVVLNILRVFTQLVISTY